METQMRVKIGFALFLSVPLLSSPAIAATEDCTASASERSTFIGNQMLRQLDAGRAADGSLPRWMQVFLGSPEEENELIAAYCSSHPQAPLQTALVDITK
jgi:hypothetical protein